MTPDQWQNLGQHAIDGLPLAMGMVSQGRRQVDRMTTLRSLMIPVASGILSGIVSAGAIVWNSVQHHEFTLAEVRQDVRELSELVRRNSNEIAALRDRMSRTEGAQDTMSGMVGELRKRKP